MKPDPKLEAIAAKVLKKMEKSGVTNNQYGSVIAIIMIIGVILTLVRIIQECNQTKLLKFNNKEKAKLMHNEIQGICIKRSLMNKWRLNRIIKQKLSPDDYKLYGTSLRDAIMDTGPELTEDETYALVEATNV
jgi:hypothetical protein